MVNSFVSKQDLDSEMTVVRNEFEMGENNPGGVLVQRMQQLAFPWHNYGNPIIGSRSDIENVPIDKLQAFYRTWYQPDNAVLIIAGRFDEAKAVSLVQKHFGALPRPTRVLPAHYTAEPTQDGERRVRLERVGDNPVVSTLYRGRPAATPTTRRLTCWSTSSATSRPAGCTARWCRRASPPTPGAASARCTIRATCSSELTSAGSKAWPMRASGCSRWSRGWRAR